MKFNYFIFSGPSSGNAKIEGAAGKRTFSFMLNNNAFNFDKKQIKIKLS
jgi:hypothetical protein